MEFILKGVEPGADCVEINIRMGPQGSLRLTHYELEEEKLLYPVLEAAEAAGIPFEKLCFSGSVDIALLMNDPSIVKKARIFLNVEQILFYLMKDDALPETREELALLFDGRFEEIAALVNQLDVECINPSFRMMTPERLAACYAHGIGLSLWTVNEEPDQERLLREDLVNMTTRNPASALRLRREIRGY